MRHDSSPSAPNAAIPLRDVCVVAHTHWDREWYHPLPRFRQRLVALIDAVLAAEDGTPFLLDGQGITLRDYASIRPEGLTALGAALRNGRLEAGPWYVLADNLIPSGEALVRNLEAGQRALAAVGATAPRVAYCPDTFGHPAALPTLAAGFGLPVGIVWRGAGGRGHPNTDAFWWRGADGARLLVHHLPPDGYEFGSALPSDPEGARARWLRLQALFAERAATGVALLLNGADHHAWQPDLPEALAALQEAAGEHVRIRRTTLQAWATAFDSAASDRALPEVHGELRDSYGYTWTLGGTLATRAHQKRRNAWLERGLVRDVEPWLALARLHDGSGARATVSTDGRLTLAQLPALLHRAWEDLLDTHPHDTLCGCSIDAVARRMDAQQEAVAAQGQGLREAALQLLLDHDVVAARSRGPLATHAPLVVRNRAARPRGGLVQLTTREFVADVPVGPGSAGMALPEPSAPRALGAPSAWPSQPIGRPRRVPARRESPQHYPDNDLIWEQRVLAWAPPVPALGVAVVPHDAPPASSPTPVRVVEDADAVHLDNGRVHLTVDRLGHVSIVVDGRLLPDALELETATDLGDSYTPAVLAPVRLACVSVRVREQGPLRGAVAIRWEAPRVASRDPDEGPLVVETTLRVSAESEVIECVVRGTNRRTNHRLRLKWHTDVDGGQVVADAAFGPVHRPPITAPASSRESVPDGMPLHRWVALTNDTVAATLVSDGLAEACAADGRLGVTLVRAIGELSRGQLTTRPGHAGWPASTPDAQCLGPFAARVALVLHGPLTGATVTAELARIRDAVDDTLLPLVGETWRDLAAPARAREVQGPALIGDAFELSTLTLSAHDARAVVLRVVNLTDQPATGAWRLPDNGPWLVTPCRLDETPIGDTTEVTQDVPLIAGPRAVLTLRVARRG